MSLWGTPQKVRFELVRTSVLFPHPCPESRTRTITSTEPELNRTVGLVLPVLVLCVSPELNFGNPSRETSLGERVAAHHAGSFDIDCPSSACSEH
jgi:hypothetical protein